MFGITSNREIPEQIRWCRTTQRFMHRKPVFSKFKGWLDDLRETKGPETIESSKECIRRRTRSSGKHPTKWNEGNLVAFKPVDRCRTRGYRIPVDREYFFLFGTIA